MLKSTYKSSNLLPAGWTEHKAPSGHTYYYNSETKQSTYKRPVESSEAPLQIDYNATEPEYAHITGTQAASLFQNNYTSSTAQSGPGHFTGGRSYQDRSRSRADPDRPRSKAAIPNCEPWILVKTRLGRRFVYNPEKNESFWKFPQDVMMAVIEMDRLEWEAVRQRKEKEQSQEMKQSLAKPESTQNQPEGDARPDGEGDGSDSGEEVEVTDSEFEEPDEQVTKRLRTGNDESGSGPSGLIEFNEEDIAYQLVQMGEDYGLDPGEFDNPDYEDEDLAEGAEGLPLSESEAEELFKDLLDDFKVNPYSTFEKAIEEGRIIEDTRYTVLPTMARRREIFSHWATARIHELQQQREHESQHNKQKKKDPKVAYMRLLHTHATPKLFWPEFKRKYRTSDAMRDYNLSDKEREKLYREYIHRLKKPEAERRRDLIALLKSVALTSTREDLNRDTPLDDLPAALETDLRYIGLPVKIRDELVQAHIATLPPPPPSLTLGR